MRCTNRPRLLRQASGMVHVWGVPAPSSWGCVAMGSPLFWRPWRLMRWLRMAHHSRRSCQPGGGALTAHGAGSLIWKLLVGVAYISIGGYLLRASSAWEWLR